MNNDAVGSDMNFAISGTLCNFYYNIIIYVKFRGGHADFKVQTFSFQRTEFMVSSIMGCCSGPEAAPEYYTTTTMFDWWCAVQFMKCCFSFMTDVMKCKPLKSLVDH